MQGFGVTVPGYLMNDLIKDMIHGQAVFEVTMKSLKHEIWTVVTCWPRVHVLPNITAAAALPPLDSRHRALGTCITFATCVIRNPKMLRIFGSQQYCCNVMRATQHPGSWLLALPHCIKLLGFHSQTPYFYTHRIRGFVGSITTK